MRVYDGQMRPPHPLALPFARPPHSPLAADPARPRRGWALLRTVGVAAALTLVAAGCPGARLTGYGVPVVEGDGAAQEAAVTRRIRRDGASAEGYATLAAIRLARDEVSSARALARRPIALDPAHVGARVVAARAASRASAPGEAARLYAEASRLEPELRAPLAAEWGDALVAQAAAEVARRRVAEAIAALDALETELPGRAAALRLARAALYLQLAETMLAQAAGGQAGALLDRAEAAGGPSDQVAYGRARARFYAGARDEAAAAFTRWAQGAPATRWAAVGDFYRDAQQAELALRAYRAARAAGDERAETWASMALAAVGQRRAGEAAEAWLEAAARTADADAAADLLVAAAEPLRQAGGPEAARAVLTEAISRAPGRWDAARALLELLVRARDHAEAERVAGAWVASSGRPAAAAWADVAELLIGADEPALAERLLTPQVAAAGRGAPALSFALAAALEGQRVQRQRGLRHRPRQGVAALRQLVARRDAALARAEAGWAADPQGLARVGAAWVALRSPREAERIADALDALDPDSPAGTLLRAEVAQRLRGRRAGARSLVEAFMARTRRERLRRAHELYARTLASARVADHGAIERHARAWLDLTPAAERAAALEALRGLCERLEGLRRLRADVLEALAAGRPDDGALQGELGEALLILGRVPEAVAAFERHVRASKAPGTAAERVGGRLRKAGRQAEAVALFATVDPEQIQRPELHIALGRHFERRGLEARAVRHYALYIARGRAGDGVSRSKLAAAGDALLEAERYPLAIKAYRAVLERDARDAKALRGLARAHLRRGRPAEADKILNRYAERPRRPSRRRVEEVARVYESEGYLERAAERWRQRMAMERSPSLPTFARLAAVYRRLGDAAALEQAARALVADPRRRAPQRQIEAAAARLAEAGLHDVAGELLTEVVRERPQDRRLLAVAFANALRRRDRDAAVALGGATARLHRDTPASWTRLCDQLEAAGLLSVAVELLDRALERRPAEGALLALRGRAKILTGATAEGHQDLIDALALAPGVREVIDVAARAYASPLYGDRWRDLLARASALSRARPEQRLDLAQALLSAGQLDEGRQLMAAYLSDNERGQLAVARAYRAAGLDREALAHYARAFEQIDASDAPGALAEAAGLIAHGAPGVDLDELARLYLLAARAGGAPPLRPLAKAYAVVGRAEVAGRWLARSDEVAPGQGALEALAEIQLGRGDLAAARATFERDLARRAVGKPAGRGALPVATAALRVVDRLLGAGAVDHAQAFVEHARRTYGDAAWSALASAIVAARRGDVGPAVRVAKRPLPSTRHGGKEAAALLARLVKELVALDRLDEADAVVARALRINGSPGLRLTRLRLAARRGDTGAVIAAARELTVGRGAAAAVEVGVALASEGQGALALPYLERGARAEPEVAARATLWLSRLAAAAGEPLEARVPRLLAAARRLRRDPLARRTLEARLRFEGGDYRGALEVLLPTLSATPKDEALASLAVRAVAQLGDERALDATLTALQAQHPDLPRLYASVVSWLRAAASPGLALRVVDRELQDRSGDPRLHLLALELALEAGFDHRAARSAEGLLALTGDASEARLALAEVYRRQGRLDLARASLDALERPTARSLRQRGRVALTAGDAEGAGAALRAYVEAAPDPASARLKAARDVEADEGPAALSRELLEPLMAAEDAPAAALDLAARAAWRAGDPAAARELWARLVARFPAGDLGHSASLAAATRAGDAEGAALVYGHARRLGRLTAAAAAELVTEVVASTPAPPEGGLAFAEAVVAEAAASMPSRGAGAARLWSRLAEARGDLDGAIRGYEDALAAAPWNGVLAHNLASLLARRGTGLARAEQLARSAMYAGSSGGAAQELPRASVLDTLGWVRFKQGKRGQALAAVDRALRLMVTPDPPAAAKTLGHRGDILESLGRVDEARIAWRACARRAPLAPAARRCAERLRGGGAPPRGSAQGSGY